MAKASGNGKSILFLQGPHGPFFSNLSQVLKTAGATVHKIGFNRGDEAFWRDKSSFTPYLGQLENWRDTFRDLIETHAVTDVVLYGDMRPIHLQAIEVARALGLRIHCFEEGYLRPYWVTYERGGVNGHSRLMDLSIDQMRDRLRGREVELPDAPARWGDMRQHAFYGALYHWHILFRNRRYRNYKTHRDISVHQEFRLHFRRLIAMPIHAARRKIATYRIRRGGYVYYLALLQLSHDSSIQHHSPFSSMPEFMGLCVEEFAAGAAPHHHLVFKTHPLEDGRVSLRKVAAKLAVKNGVSDRVHFVRGGKLARLLDFARGVVTINSTAAQQALWRGLPLKVFGDSVYNKPEFVSDQPMAAFFADPSRPDAAAYRDYRHYLLETSQVMGGFYASKSRQRLIRNVVDMVLAEHDPYDSLHDFNESPQQQLRLIP